MYILVQHGVLYLEAHVNGFKKRMIKKKKKRLGKILLCLFKIGLYSLLWTAMLYANGCNLVNTSNIRPPEVNKFLAIVEAKSQT